MPSGWIERRWYPVVWLSPAGVALPPDPKPLGRSWRHHRAVWSAVTRPTPAEVANLGHDMQEIPLPGSILVIVLGRRGNPTWTARCLGRG